jgi:TctA family transporter
MKNTFTIVTSAIITLSPTFSLCAFSIYGGKNELFDVICFLTFGATCYTLARIQTYTKSK